MNDLGRVINSVHDKVQPENIQEIDDDKNTALDTFVKHVDKFHEIIGELATEAQMKSRRFDKSYEDISDDTTVIEKLEVITGNKAYTSDEYKDINLK